jgi:tetrahydromethanopterin S-methyltransferase subunit F
VGCLSLHKKVYLLLTTVKGIFIVSNAYEEFEALVDAIVGRVGQEKVEEEVRLQSGRSRTGIANIVSAWVAAAFMVGIILMKMFPFLA